MMLMRQIPAGRRFFDQNFVLSGKLCSIDGFVDATLTTYIFLCIFDDDENGTLELVHFSVE